MAWWLTCSRFMPTQLRLAGSCSSLWYPRCSVRVETQPPVGRRHTIAAVAYVCGRDGLPCFGLSARCGHLKAAALNGHRDRLSAEELASSACTRRVRVTARTSPGRSRAFSPPRRTRMRLSAVLKRKATCEG